MTQTIEKTEISFVFDKDSAQKFFKYSLIAGGLLSLLGIAGMIVPQVTSFVVEAFLGWLLVLAGILSGYMIFINPRRAFISWLKPVLLVATGVLMLVQPLAGIAALALLLTAYLLIDAAAGFGLAYDYYPHKGWGWLAFNGFMSLVLAALVFVGWPSQSAIIIGLLVGISIFFDGLALIMLGFAAKNSVGKA